MHIQDANDDMEVNEDFLLFMEQSKKHREEWKVAKFKNNQEATQTTASITNQATPDVEPKVRNTIVNDHLKESRSTWGLLLQCEYSVDFVRVAQRYIKLSLLYRLL